MKGKEPVLCVVLDNMDWNTVSETPTEAKQAQHIALLIEN